MTFAHLEAMRTSRSVPHQCSCSIQHGLVWQEVFLGCMVAAVGQFIVLHQEAQVSHFPNLQLGGLCWVPVIRKVKITSPESRSSTWKQRGAGSTYRRPHVLFGSLTLFSGALLPPNHFLVAVKRERLRPFLEMSCGESSMSRAWQELSKHLHTSLWNSALSKNTHFPYVNRNIDLNTPCAI